MRIDVIGFDADDTLWHNERLFSLTQEKFAALIGRYRNTPWTGQELFETEMRNLRYFGYGIKGFTLSMIETAIELTGGQISGHDIQTIIAFAKEMLESPTDLLDHVADIVPRLADTYQLILITKGDLFDQETKIARSGLAQHFAAIEIVSDKTPESYQRVLARHRVEPRHFLMVGNSLRSDILPAQTIGAQAVYIPYHITWAHETVADHEPSRYYQLEHIGQLPELVEQLTAVMSDDRRLKAEG
jgi:putative hydrolase of the HAD superfamily